MSFDSRPKSYRNLINNLSENTVPEPLMGKKKIVWKASEKDFNVSEAEKIFPPKKIGLRIVSTDPDLQYGQPTKALVKYNDNNTNKYNKLIPSTKRQIAVKNSFKSSIFASTEEKLNQPITARPKKGKSDNNNL